MRVSARSSVSLVYDCVRSRMPAERFVVEYNTSCHCFATLSLRFKERMNIEANAIKVLHDEKEYYLSCTFGILDYRILSIGGTFAKCLNIKEGDSVFVSPLSNVLSLSSINIIPLTTNDRELLELQMEKVQSSLLSQVRIVAKEQSFVAWISKYSSVVCTVEDLEPKCMYGRLEQLSEVHVLDPPQEENDSTKASNILKPLAAIFSRFFGGNDTEAIDLPVLPKRHALLRAFRVLPIPQNINFLDKLKKGPCHVFVPKKSWPQNIKSTKGSVMCKIKKLPENLSHIVNTSLMDYSTIPKFPEEYIARMYILEDVLQSSNRADYYDLDSAHSPVYVTNSLRATLKIKIRSKVIVQIIEEDKHSKATSLDVFPVDTSITEESFKNYLKCSSANEPLLLNSSSILFLHNKAHVIEVSPVTCNYALIHQEDLKNLVIRIQPSLALNGIEIIESVDSYFQKDPELMKISTRCIDNLLENCKRSIDLSLCLGPVAKANFKYDRENILICGGLGSGKTTVCKMLIDYYSKVPHFVYTHMIDCRSLKGKKVETLQKMITIVMNQCVYYQPSILFLDDLENVTKASLNDEENTTEATNASRITDMLLSTITQYQKYHYISIIATCVSVSNIGMKLRPVRGAQFFRTVLSIPNYEKEHRVHILELRLKDKFYVPEDTNWNYYGNKTEGWMPQDLVDLTEKAIFAAWKHHCNEKTGKSEKVVVTEKDINAALDNFTPMSLQNLQLYKKGDITWSNIGGLTDMKRSLTEILQWPLQYPEIFKNPPIKLQSGILLYGMPGTGKTMLAKAIAGECGVNLISIKGPELLSKYIGVSEESVRNIFEKARRAKPCVLFFDEFDSLAPRRGHDSTGVTDRVVNQLLTQLDGIEDREGVAVVAASSRPDMLDPALLRPGRLDKCLYCPLPNKVEREAIFAVLCESQKVNKAQLDLKELAALTIGFTGADINAVITQARLSAYETILVTATDRKVEAIDIPVTQAQLVESIRSTRPSVSNEEKLKYDMIYARFSRADTVNDVLNTQKATLA